MYRQYLFATIFCLVLAETLSIECYVGANQYYQLGTETNSCTYGQSCTCVKFRYQCTTGDTLCTTLEQPNGAMVWVYSIIPKSACKLMEKDKTTFSNVKCCTKNKCNKPDIAFGSLRSIVRKFFADMDESLDE